MRFLQDFLVACLSWLPVMRRFYFERCADPKQAMECYEAVETLALPFMGRIISIHEEIKELYTTDPDRVAPTIDGMLREAGRNFKMTIEQVDDDATLEMLTQRPGK